MTARSRRRSGKTQRSAKTPAAIRALAGLARRSQAIATIAKLHEATDRPDLYNARLIPIYCFDAVPARPGLLDAN